MENEELTHNSYKAITHYESKRDGPCVAIHELIRCVLESSSESQKRSLIEYVVAQEAFTDAMADVVRGFSDYESHDCSGNSSADALRRELLTHAGDAANKIVSALMEENQRLRDRLKVGKQHIEKILEDWPEPYKKYIPQEAYSYSHFYVPSSDAEKLIEYVKTQQEARRVEGPQ